MGPFAAAIPYVIAAVGTAASIYNTNRTARKADEAAAAGIRKQAGVQRRADSRITEELEKLGKSSGAGDQAGALEQYQQATRGTEQQARAGQAIEGLSSEYDEATRAGQEQTGKNIGNIADLLSRIDAPMLQRQREGFGTADLATALGTLGRESQGQGFLADMRVRGVRRNPYIDAFASGLSTAAQNYGSNAGGTTGTGQVTYDQSAPFGYKVTY